MQASAIRESSQARTANGVVYRITCQNRGCGFSFDLSITPANAGMLGAMIACPRCRRPGGTLKREGRIGDRLFAAKLVFRDSSVFQDEAEERFSKRLNN
jgi:hypothetical protein